MFEQLCIVVDLVGHFVSCRDFGTKVISVKPLLKQLQTLMEDRDKTVREETKLLVVEIYRWIGPALQPQLTNLKPVQVLCSQLVTVAQSVYETVVLIIYQSNAIFVLSYNTFEY